MKTFMTALLLVLFCVVYAEEYHADCPECQRQRTLVYRYKPRTIVRVQEPYVQTRVIVRDPIIMPKPGTEVLIARPTQIEYYDQKALIQRGFEILRWNNGFPDPVTGYQCYWDPRLPGHNDPGVAFPRIAKPQEMYGARW